jgi:hypothetical protein
MTGFGLLRPDFRNENFYTTEVAEGAEFFKELYSLRSLRALSFLNCAARGRIKAGADGGQIIQGVITEKLQGPDTRLIHYLAHGQEHDVEAVGDLAGHLNLIPLAREPESRGIGYGVF